MLGIIKFEKITCCFDADTKVDSGYMYANVSVFNE